MGGPCPALWGHLWLLPRSCWCWLFPGVPAWVCSECLCPCSPPQMIDGEAFLLLTQADIVKIMSVKLGPALKIYNAILMFKNADDTLK